MDVRIATQPTETIFIVSKGNLQITKISDGQPQTLDYQVSPGSAPICTELEWLAQNQPGVFRLLWLAYDLRTGPFYMFEWYAAKYGIHL